MNTNVMAALGPNHPEPVFQSQNVNITRTLVQIGGASYPVNGIGSVMVIKPRRVGLFAFGVIGVLIGLAAIRSGGVLVVAFGALLITGGLLPISARSAWTSTFGALLITGGLLLPHRLMIRTASSNQQALTSRNRAFLFSVKQALETRVAMRG